MLLQFFRIFLLGMATFWCAFAASAKEAIYSSVSPEFTHGLHAKYLNYLADKVGMDLRIFPMPFARRLASLEQGEIDIMVGVKSLHKQNDAYVFLKPSYDSARWAYFIKAEDSHIFADEEDRKSIILGVTIDDKEIQKMTKLNYKKIVPVSSLSQKILLLEKGRIDSFTHFEGSAMQMIKDLGFEDELILAPYQTEDLRHYYFAMSNNSPLLKYKDKFEQIIAEAVASGDFLHMAMEHYQNQ